MVDSGFTNHLITTGVEKFLIDKRKDDHPMKVAKEDPSLHESFESTLHLLTEDIYKIKLENVLMFLNLTLTCYVLKRECREECK